MPEGAPVLGEVAFAAESIGARVSDLARAIERDYAGRVPLLVGVLKSSAIFLADLARAVRVPVELDILAISSYTREHERGGGVRIEADVSVAVERRHVVVVEDVVDTGLTLQYVLRMLGARAPASLAVCTLLDRAHRRIVDVPIRYRGFEIGDEFLVGYGLDFREAYRHLPDLRLLRVPAR
ncbi:MAG TPA: hypoxanthine phosphoribosyltransferase [Candidatus Dormibacteraeota bacterium]|nr:hypoxanthine phosphoribosyltransferase [Candidatus Dormibacteraeota bacterium]